MMARKPVAEVVEHLLRRSWAPQVALVVAVATVVVEVVIMLVVYLVFPQVRDPLRGVNGRRGVEPDAEAARAEEEDEQHQQLRARAPVADDAAVGRAEEQPAEGDDVDAVRHHHVHERLLMGECI